MATFRALALRLADDPSAGLHYVYFRQYQAAKPKRSGDDHSAENGDDDDESMEIGTPHALQVLNVPQLFEEHDLVELFSVFGPVQSAMLVSADAEAGGALPSQPQPVLQWTSPHRPPPGRPGRCGRVYFEEADSLEAALRVDTLQMVQPAVPALAPAGLQKWIASHQRRLQNEEQLVDAVNRFMAAFDKHQQQLDEARRRGPVMDEDGFILVVNKHRQRKLAALPDDDDLADPDLPQQSQKRRFRDALGDGKARKTKKRLQHSENNIYKFQKKADKLEKLTRLQKGFQKDRKKIHELRLKRRFGVPSEE